jgi:hypothetical protein
MNGIITDFFEGFLTVGDLIRDLRQARPTRSHGIGSWLVWIIVILSLMALLASPYVAYTRDCISAALWIAMSGILSILGIFEIKRRLRDHHIQAREQARIRAQKSW